MVRQLADLQDLKAAFVGHCRGLGGAEDYIKVCENKFEAIEKALIKADDEHKVLNLLKRELEFYFDGQHKTVNISRAHRIVLGKRLTLSLTDKSFETLKKEFKK